MSTARTLYNIADDIAALDQLLDESGGEVSEPVEQWWAENATNLADKVDQIGFYLRDLEAQADACRAEAVKLQEKARSAEKKVESIKRYVDLQMVKLNVRKFKGTIYTLSKQKNGGSPPIILLVPPKQLDQRFQKVTVEANLAELRLAILAGTVPSEVARFGEVGESIRLR